MGHAGTHAPINPLSLGGMDVASQFYLGKPYQQPGLQKAWTPPTGDPRMQINRQQLGGAGKGPNIFGEPGGGWRPDRGGVQQR